MTDFSTTTDLQKAISQRILILDGGMGTLIQSHGLTAAHFNAPSGVRDFSQHPTSLEGLNDILSLTAPEVIGGIHRDYLRAGADIISTNTFNSNPIALADYSLSDFCYELNLHGARLARTVADEFPDRRFVAGSVGPTNRSASMSPEIERPGFRNVSFQELAQGYATQIQGLIDGGVDIILAETCFDTLNCKALIFALRQIVGLKDFPLMISATIADSSGRILSGQTLEAFYHSVIHGRPLSVGLNCAFGAAQMLPYAESLSSISECFTSAHPNAGLPNVMGGYDESPEQMAAVVEQYMARSLVNIVGGCCGTTPAYIAHLSRLAKKYKPRTPHIAPETEGTILTGSEVLKIDSNSNFISVGERTNVAGSAKFARLIRQGLYNEALSVALAQEASGANIIDVCMDEAMIDAPAAMGDFLNLMASEPTLARLPVMIDSSSWQAIIAGLETQQGKAVVNSISLKEGQEEFLHRATTIQSYGAAVIVMLFDERGQADTFERKIEIAQRAYNLLRSIDFPAQDIIFDPNILAVATGMHEHDNYALDFIEATRWIKQNCSSRVLISGGVSNLSFSFRGNNTVREAMHTAFLYHARKAGMDMAIVNPEMIQIYDQIAPDLLLSVEDVILNRHPEAADRLITLAEQLKADPQGTDKQTHPENHVDESLTPSQRIINAIIKGTTNSVESDTMEVLEQMNFRAIDLVDQVLMEGMSKVGERFSAGKMFLPQVVKSARVMKLCVAVLEPYIKQGAATEQKATIVVATVKGDVHDIGKNIVSIVLECNGYKIIDLGVMTPTEVIIESVKQHNPVALVLSGLITPSLEQMQIVATRMEQEGLKTPIAIGGATTSALHTAVKIAPSYSGLVAHSTDASSCATLIGQIVNNPNFAAQYKVKQEQYRQKYEAEKLERTSLTLEQARVLAPKLSFTGIKQPKTTGQRVVLKNYDLSKLIDRIDWNFFLVEWGIKGRLPEILNHPQKGEQVKELLDNARQMLAQMLKNNSVQANAILATLAARSKGEDIFVKPCSCHTCCASEVRLPQSRDLVRHYRSLADFIAPKDDYLTIFALSIANSTTYTDQYQVLMAQILCNRLAEALAIELSEVICRYDAPKPPLRVAIGYPGAADHSAKRAIFDILEVESQIPLTLTESYMMDPGSSISGYMFHHADAQYL